jgi:hypothetical protein
MPIDDVLGVGVWPEMIDKEDGEDGVSTPDT